MKKLITFLDENSLYLFGLISLILIPLYPKFPFIRIPDTYISIRLEDFFMGLMAIAFALQLARRKVHFDIYFVKLFVFFWVILGLSFLINAFATHTIVFPKIGLLHTLRRVEYMFPFFVLYAAVYARGKKLAHTQSAVNVLDTILNVAFWGVLLVCLYALGQKSALLFEPVRSWLLTVSQNNTGLISGIAYFFFRFFDFPAVQTMNSEFAKGFLLNLTPEARVSSTFAGHYDLAAYLVFFIPLIASYILRNKNKVGNSIIYILSILTLILTASRASFGAFIVSITLYFAYLRKWRALAFTLLITLLLMFANKDMTNRFMDMFQKKRVFENVQTGTVVINQEITTTELPAGSEFVIEGKPQVIMTEEDKKDLTKQLVKKEQEDARKSGKRLTEEEAMRLVNEKYKELQNFVAKDVVAGDTSLATRTQVEWPRAINAFLSNPAFGTGPSSITESTDGDYFRWLGETGILGFGLFTLILGSIGIQVFKKGRTLQSNERMTLFAFCAGMIALLGNATLIDVFEASKVAYIFWIVAGVFVAFIHIPQSESQKP